MASAPAADRRTVFLVDYALFARDWAAWLEQRGHGVEWLVPQALSVEFFVKACRVVRPRFVASINFSPELAVLCSVAQTPYLSWTVDPLGPERFVLYPETDPAWLLAFAHRHETALRLQSLGLRDTEYLPLAASGRRQPVLDAQALEAERAPVSFVASSLAAEGRLLAEQLAARGATELVPAFAELVERWLSERDGDVGFTGLLPDASNLPADLHERLPAGVELGQLADWVNGVLSYRLRARRVAALAPQGIETYGDAGWQGSGARYRGVADHGEQLTRIYCASRLNLDVPRIYQRDIVTMRVFDIMACGGVVLTEPSADLLELFCDGTELVCYRSDDELRSKVEHLLSHEPERAAIAASARSAVLRGHLLEHRFERMAAGLARRGF